MNNMAHISYYACDICGKHIDDGKSDELLFGTIFKFTRCIKLRFGKRERSKLCICDSCLKKLKKVNKDIESKEIIWDKVMKYYNEHYDVSNTECQSSFLDGAEQMAELVFLDERINNAQ